VKRSVGLTQELGWRRCRVATLNTRYAPSNRRRGGAAASPRERGRIWPLGGGPFDSKYSRSTASPTWLAGLSLCTSTNMSSYREMLVWQTCVDLVDAVCRTVRRFRREELFVLSGQMRSAAISIPCNTAEGCGRWSSRRAAAVPAARAPLHSGVADATRDRAPAALYRRQARRSAGHCGSRRREAPQRLD
jgi:hypothetical protein